jgi:hypothetical protein
MTNTSQGGATEGKTRLELCEIPPWREDDTLLVDQAFTERLTLPTHFSYGLMSNV